MTFIPEPAQETEPGPIFGWPQKRTIWSCIKAKGVLLVRYFIFRSALFSIYLHNLRLSDEQRAQHDHPWSFITILLTSGYFEYTPKGKFWRPRFSILWRPAEWQHRLELVKPCWTLVFRFARRRDWGFFAPTGYINWRDYHQAMCD
jgi:hypothetical protein